MIYVDVGFLFRRRLYYFCNDLNKVNKSGCSSLLIVNGLEEKEPSFHSKIVKTFITNLAGLEIENLLSSMNSTTRNSVHFCEKNEVLFESYDGIIPAPIIKDFLKTLKGMYKEKGLKDKIVSPKRIKTFCKNDSLIITRTLDKKTNKAISYHVYITDKTNVVLWFSCSLFRKKEDKSFVGKCNRYHHYKDFLLFLDNKYKSYDWGGVSSFEDPNGIDSFKYSFPGEKMTKYEIYYPLNFIGKMYLRVKKI